MRGIHRSLDVTTKGERELFRWSRGFAVAFLAVAVVASGKEPSRPAFKYVGGTEQITPGCQGPIEMNTSTLTFKCAQETLTIPYSSITLMQYRPDVSRKVRKMDLGWKLKPPSGGSRGKRNRYFAVVFGAGGKTHAAVWEVQPSTMLPYLAELDLKTGKRVEVKEYQEYE